MTITYVSHPSCLQHDTGPVHPESAARLWAIEDALRGSPLDLALRRVDAPAAERAQLLSVHDTDYLDRLAAALPEHGRVWLDADTAICAASLDAAVHAAGACVYGVEELLCGAARSVFCAVRPPGHHAERGRALGGCLLNNVAVAAAHALETHGLRRVAIVDFDAHYGNGTARIFANDPRVLYCSVHQANAFPFPETDTDPNPNSTGEANARRAQIVSVPLAAGSTGAELGNAVEQHWLPALDAFSPQLLMISAGFDGHIEDDLAQLQLREADYAWMTGVLRGVAERHAQGRILSVLEGGYALQALGRCVVAHLRALLG